MQIMCGGCAAGELTVTPCGQDLIFDAAFTPPGEGLWRLVAVGRCGGLYLGTAEGPGHLRRRFSACLTGPVGELLCCRAEKCGGSGWVSARAEDFPELRLPRGALTRKSGDGTVLALPWTVGTEFPVPSLFCLAAVCRMQGREWLLLRFDGQGWPYIEKFPGK